MSRRGEKLPTPLLVAYFATLAAFFVASFYPEYRIWGITWWAYFPLWTKFLLLAFGVAAPFALDILIGRSFDDEDDISPATYRWLAGGIVTTTASLFYFLRARTHFLGDGYTLLSLMANENHLIKPREFGGTIIQYGVYKLMGAGGEDRALLAYQIISIGAGVVFLLTSLLIANRLFSRRLDRLLFLLLMSTGGYMLMFFGYVENYAFFLVFTLIFVGAAILVAEKRISRWWIIAAQAAPIFFHIFGVVFIPATIYLLAHNSPVERWMISRPRWVLWLVVVAFVGAVTATFLYFYFSILFLRIAVLPFVSDQFTVGGYTMFSLPHLIDYANLILIVFPGTIVLATLFFSQLRESWQWTPVNVGTLLAVAGSFGAAFIFDPKLGMPRDWDLFGFAGITLCLFVFVILRNALPARTVFRYTILIVVTNFLVLGPRVAVTMTPQFLTAYVENFAKLDPAKSGPTFYVLIKWLQSHGEADRAAHINAAWSRLSPEEDIIGSFQSGTTSLDTTALLTVLDRSIIRDITNWKAWANKGVVKYWHGKYDTAVLCLERAAALNPSSAWIYLNLGLGYWKLGDLDTAAKCAEISHNLDSTSIKPLLLLSTICRQLNDTMRLASVIGQIAERSDAPKEYLTGLTDFLHAQSRNGKASHGASTADTKAPLSSVERSPLASQLVTAAATLVEKDSTIWDEAVRMAVTKNPSSWVAWGNLGVVYLRKDAFDSAQAVLEISVSINPINSTNFSNLAFAQYYRNDFVSAEKNWLKSRSLDSLSILPLIGLAKLYQKTNQHEKYLEYFIKVVSRPDAPGEYLKTYGDYFLMQKRWREADLAYQRAITNGYPKSRLDSLYRQYPQLTNEN